MCLPRNVLALAALFVGSVHSSWDYAVANGDLLEFYINQTKTDTVRFKSQTLGALAYDEVHNTILYVNKQKDNDTICAFNMSTMQYKYLTERNGRNIRGLAFDPATELLFFTDTKERTINWISLKPGFKNSVYGTTLIKMNDGIPTDIAVDSCKGYIYWISTDFLRPTINRARFNGTERRVVNDAGQSQDPYSLNLDQETQKIYWLQPCSHSSYYISSTDLNGRNKMTNAHDALKKTSGKFLKTLNAWTVSSKLKLVNCSYDTIYEYHGSYRQLHISMPVGVVANYKLSDQIKGLQDCQALTSLIQNASLIDNTFKLATQYGEFCVHGMRVDGHSLCKCTPGYIGDRCDVSVCENYCFHGNCSVNDDGLPKCRCDAGYSGDRCQVHACDGYCQNGGDCSLNGTSEPVCECKGDFAGVRCEVSDCLNYCIYGNCSINDERLPECRCDAGYSGDRCQVHACDGYCQNGGDCSLNGTSEPVCECKGDFAGVRCEVSDCLNYCIYGNCSINDERLPECSCNAGYSGERCEVNVCHGYCMNDGECSLNEENEPFCQCSSSHEGSRCEVVKTNSLPSTLTSYSSEGNLAISDILSKWRKPFSKMTVILESS